MGVLFKGDHRRATHLSERKEKKKKDKVADILEHPGTQPEIVKRVRKKDKTNVREISVEPGIVSCDPEAREKKKKRKRDREDEEPPSADQNKKRKRKKSSGATSSPTSLVPANDSSLEVADTSGVTGTIATTSEMKTKKNQRKSKSEKPRKKKATGGDAVNISIEAEPAVPPEGQLSRKRKKSKQPAYPDPSDDPDLTEQSQKGSYPNSKSLALLTLFDCHSSYLHLFPIHIPRDLEIQQSSPKLGHPQRLDAQGGMASCSAFHSLTGLAFS